jgi:hypothetical protein
MFENLTSLFPWMQFFTSIWTKPWIIDYEEGISLPYVFLIVLFFWLVFFTLRKHWRAGQKKS